MTKEKQKKIRVFLADGHPIVREGVRAYLAGRQIEVAGEAANDQETLSRVIKLAPDVIILDVNLPARDSGELAGRLRKLVPEAKIIAFSIHSSQEYVVRMARCGVHGYVMKDQPPAVLLDAIREVYRGGRYFPPGMAAGGPAPAPGDAALTGRELEVLALLAGGFSNKGIAAKLGISVRTAETHREHLSHKLNILTVAGLTKYAIRSGFTTLKVSGPGARQ